jgi:WD40 repeat protein
VLSPDHIEYPEEYTELPQGIDLSGGYTLVCDESQPDPLTLQQAGKVVVVLDYVHSCPNGSSTDPLPAALSPDGSLLVTGQYDGYMVYVWDARTGKQLMRLNTHGFEISFSTDGAWLRTRSQNGVLVWKVEDILHHVTSAP